MCGNHFAQQWNVAIATAHFQSAEYNHPGWNLARILSYSAVNCQKLHHDKKILKNLLLLHTKLEFLELIILRIRRLTTDFSNWKILLSKWTLFPTASKLSWKVSYPNTNLVQSYWTTGRRTKVQHICLYLLCTNMAVMIGTGPTEQGLMQRTLCRMGSS